MGPARPGFEITGWHLPEGRSPVGGSQTSRPRETELAHGITLGLPHERGAIDTPAGGGDPC